MAAEWVAVGKGIRYREHESRKHGKRPDRYWTIVYKRDGKTYNEAVGWWSQGASQAQAEELLAQLRQNWRSGQGPQSLKEMREAGQAAREEQAKEQIRVENESLTLQDFWDKTYWPTASVRKSPDTMKIENWQFRAWVAPALGHLPLGDIRASHVESMVAKMRGAGKAPRTQEHVKTLLSGILTAAINEELISGPNPCHKVKLPKTDNQRIRFLSTEEATTLLETLGTRSPQVRDEALLALFCGLRAKEIFSLTWADIDFENKMIFIKDSKNKKLNRHAYMTVEVESMLKSRMSGQTPGALVFPKMDGEKQKAISTTFRETVSDLGWNNGVTDRRLKVVFHSLRHTFASWLVMDGVPLFTVSKLMGHSDISMTMRYSHLAPDHLRQGAHHMEGKLTGKAKKEGD